MLFVNLCFDFVVFSISIEVFYVILSESLLFLKFKCHSRTNVIPSGGECNAPKQFRVN